MRTFGGERVAPLILGWTACASLALLYAGERLRATAWPATLAFLLVVASAGVIRHRPRQPTVWWLLILSCAAMTAHVAINCGVSVGALDPQVRSAVVGPLVVVMTVCAGFAGALVGHPLLRAPATRAPAALGLVLFLGTTVVVQLGARANTDWDLDAPARLTSVLFVLCALALTVSLGATGTTLRRLLRFSDGALVAAPVPSALGYGIAQLAGSSGPLAGGSWLGPLWTAALVAAAASHSTMRSVGTPLIEHEPATSSLRRLPAVATTILLLTPLVESATRIAVAHPWVLKAAAVVVVGQAVLLVALLDRPSLPARRPIGLVATVARLDPGELVDRGGQPEMTATLDLVEPSLLSELGDAVRAGGLTMYYQPVYRADDGALAGAEALARWDHPRLGLLCASQFLPALDDAVASAVDEWALRTVLRDASAVLASATVDEPYLAVNLSPRRAEQADLPDMVARELRAAGVEADGLVIELTETEAVRDWDRLRANLSLLQHRGFWVAVDDFGAGHANLLHLTRLHPDVVKVDRELVEAVATSARGRRLLRSLVAVAKAAGAAVVAEGVLDSSWVPELAAMGVDYVQGYALGMPVPLAEFRRDAAGTSWGGPVPAWALPPDPMLAS